MIYWIYFQVLLTLENIKFRMCIGALYKHIDLKKAFDNIIEIWSDFVNLIL